MTITMVLILTLLLSAHAWLCARQVSYIGSRHNDDIGRYAKAKAYVALLSYMLDILWCALLLVSDAFTTILDLTGLIITHWLLRCLVLGSVQMQVERHFGFGRMTWQIFGKVILKALCLRLVLTFGAVNLVFYYMPMTSHMAVFLWVWLVWFCLDSAVITIRPWTQSRLDCALKPLEDADLLNRVTHMCLYAGYEPVDVYVQDGSQRTSHANARFEGIGPFKRIVLNDSLLDHLNEDEILSVIAHELGHHAHRHIFKFQLLKGGLTLLGILIFTQFSTSLSHLVISAPAISAVALPILNAYIRSCEYQADRFASFYGGGAETFLRALDKIHVQNAVIQAGDRVYDAVYFGHPRPQARAQYLRKINNGATKIHVAGG
ncbi:peptidase M48 [Terasakiella brassicae]|uniref:Peptidase M48 n=1 Tax=Terasakiella brassicae TaxID=1634917 RepID=A0A917C410_9PROT|nr:M48 family metalloprotease [Terasakiella brassicae]GGF68968.1 peptidase M48 [Terasakiella brassicae]